MVLTAEQEKLFRAIEAAAAQRAAAIGLELRPFGSEKIAFVSGGTSRYDVRFDTIVFDPSVPNAAEIYLHENIHAQLAMGTVLGRKLLAATYEKWQRGETVSATEMSALRKEFESIDEGIASAISDFAYGRRKENPRANFEVSHRNPKIGDFYEAFIKNLEYYKFYKILVSISELMIVAADVYSILQEMASNFSVFHEEYGEKLFLIKISEKEYNPSYSPVFNKIGIPRRCIGDKGSYGEEVAHFLHSVTTDEIGKRPEFSWKKDYIMEVFGAIGYMLAGGKSKMANALKLLEELPEGIIKMILELPLGEVMDDPTVEEWRDNIIHAKGYLIGEQIAYRWDEFKDLDLIHKPADEIERIIEQKLVPKTIPKPRVIGEVPAPRVIPAVIKPPPKTIIGLVGEIHPEDTVKFWSNYYYRAYIEGSRSKSEKTEKYLPKFLDWAENILREEVKCIAGAEPDILFLEQPPSVESLCQEFNERLIEPIELGWITGGLYEHEKRWKEKGREDFAETIHKFAILSSTFFSFAKEIHTMDREDREELIERLGMAKANTIREEYMIERIKKIIAQKNPSKVVVVCGADHFSSLKEKLLNAGFDVRILIDGEELMKQHKQIMEEFTAPQVIPSEEAPELNIEDVKKQLIQAVKAHKKELARYNFEVNIDFGKIQDAYKRAAQGEEVKGVIFGRKTEDTISIMDISFTKGDSETCMAAGLEIIGNIVCTPKE